MEGSLEKRDVAAESCNFLFSSVFSKSERAVMAYGMLWRPTSIVVVRRVQHVQIRNAVLDLLIAGARAVLMTFV